jgi:hypothetical protein
MSDNFNIMQIIAKTMVMIEIDESLQLHEIVTTGFNLQSGNKEFNDLLTDVTKVYTKKGVEVYALTMAYSLAQALCHYQNLGGDKLQLYAEFCKIVSDGFGQAEFTATHRLIRKNDNPITGKDIRDEN